MIKSKTYNGQAGLNYIQSSDIAFAIIYVVKKEGTQHDKYISGSTDRTYIYQNSLGRINFPTAFAAGGEKVFVIFKTTTGTEPENPPGVCVPVEIEDSEMPDAIVNVSYSKAFPLNGSAPYTLNVIQKPSWAIVHISLGGVVTVMGFPDIAGPETLEFSVSNCGGSAPTILHTFTTLANSDNIFISSPSISRITSVADIPFVITGGSFPVYLSSSVSGIHNDYTGIISVAVTNIIFPKTLRLIKNGVQLEGIAVSSNGTYPFASQTYLSTDVIQIILN